MRPILFGDTHKLCSTRLNNLFNQIKYIKSILKQFGITKSKFIQIFFTINCKLSKDMGFQNDIDL